jgi:hypothetical protein
MAWRDIPATAGSRLGGSLARNGVPGRKFTLYRSRMSNRTSTSRYIIYLSAAVLTAAALAAITVVAATGGQSGSQTRRAAQRPALQAHPASIPRLPVRTSSANTAITLLSTRATAGTRRHHLGWKKEIAWRMMSHRFGWRPKYQFRSLNRLWERESSWRIHAYNAYSGAYGIPQAVPGSKMSTAGSDWQSSARVQIRWGLRYIRAVYGRPRNAWAHELAYGWY